jgi:hypothetical protein
MLFFLTWGRDLVVPACQNETGKLTLNILSDLESPRTKNHCIQLVRV